MRRRFIVTVVLFLQTTLLSAQIDPLDQILSNLKTEESAISEWLLILTERPVNINRAPVSLLKSIPFLADQDIEKIIQNRPFTKKTEIAELLGREIYNMIRPFITVVKEDRFPKFIVRHRLQYTVEKNHAFRENLFYGSPIESYSRLHIAVDPDLSVGLLVQKDVGERNFFDHYNAFICWEMSSCPLKLIFGNYSIQQAQGLLFSSTFSLPKNAHVLAKSFSQSTRLTPLLSSNETGGFWGCAAEYGTNNTIKAVFFYSQLKKDGVKSEDGDGVFSLYQSGYHRTATEKENENTLKEEAFGGTITFPVFPFQIIGISLVSVKYNPPFVNDYSLNELRRRFYNFNGDGLMKYTLFYSLKYEQIYFNGEIIPEGGDKLAHQYSVNLDTDKWQFVIKWWHLARSFHSAFGNSITDSGPFPKPNQGVLLGGCGKVSDRLFLSFYWSMEKDLWRTYYSQRPLRNKDFYIRSNYHFNNNTDILIQYNRNTDQVLPAESDQFIIKNNQRLCLQFEKKFSTRVRFRSRINFVYNNFSHRHNPQTGVNFYQDIYSQITQNLSVYFRFSSFNTDDYDSRVYEYENDLPGLFSNYALYGKGIKWYFMLELKWTTHYRFLAKYRKIVYDGVDSMGSGLLSIDEAKKQDIHLQIEIRY